MAKTPARRPADDVFRVEGTFVEEAYSAPPGAFEIKSNLRVTATEIVVAPRLLVGAGPKLRIAFADVLTLRAGPRHVYVEWPRTGVVHGLWVVPESGRERDRLVAALAARLGRGPEAEA